MAQDSMESKCQEVRKDVTILGHIMAIVCVTLSAMTIILDFILSALKSS